MVTRPLNILVGYEKSGVLRRQLAQLGHNVTSVDLQPSDDDSPDHIIGDVWCCINHVWLTRSAPDLAFFFPMCTYLTTSAAWAYKDPDYDKYPPPKNGYHQKTAPTTLTGAARRKARADAISNFKRLEQLPFPTVIENPGRSFLATMHRKPDQIIHPYQFGDNASKATGLWMSPAPPLKPLIAHPALMISPRQVVSPKTGKIVNRWANQTDSGQNNVTPGDDRWNERSKTYLGIARALATQIPPQVSNVT